MPIDGMFFPPLLLSFFFFPNGEKKGYIKHTVLSPIFLSFPSFPSPPSVVVGKLSVFFFFPKLETEESAPPSFFPPSSPFWSFSDVRKGRRRGAFLLSFFFPPLSPYPEEKKGRVRKGPPGWPIPSPLFLFPPFPSQRKRRRKERGRSGEVPFPLPPSLKTEQVKKERASVASPFFFFLRAGPRRPPFSFFFPPLPPPPRRAPRDPSKEKQVGFIDQPSAFSFYLFSFPLSPPPLRK